MTKPHQEPTQITTSAQWDIQAPFAIHAITKTNGTPGDAGITSAAFDARYGGGGSGGGIDGGTPTSNYTSTTPIDGGTP